MDLIDKITSFLESIDSAVIIKYGTGIIGAILVWIVGGFVIKLLTNAFDRILEKKKIDDSLKPFLRSIVTVFLKIALAITVLGMLGVEMTSFIALIGAAGLAIGMALSGTLQNFAGGVMLLIFRPYKVGDLITAQGHTGVVKEIQVFVTILTTPENKTVFIPNGPLSNGDITNFTTQGMMRVDLTIGISYSADIKKAKDTLMQVMISHPKVMKDPEPFVGVSELADSSVNLAVRPFCSPADYWAVYFDIYEQGKIALDKAQIEIPFPQVDVHMSKS